MNSINFSVAPVMIDSSRVDLALPSHESLPPPGLFLTWSEYFKFSREWKKLSDLKNLTSQDMAIFAILMDRPLGATFSPIRCPVKLRNGSLPWRELSQILYLFSISPKRSHHFSFLPDAYWLIIQNAGKNTSSEKFDDEYKKRKQSI
jgi:hypothetical protein